MSVASFGHGCTSACRWELSGHQGDLGKRGKERPDSSRRGRRQLIGRAGRRRAWEPRRKFREAGYGAKCLWLTLCLPFRASCDSQVLCAALCVLGWRALGVTTRATSLQAMPR